MSRRRSADDDTLTQSTTRTLHMRSLQNGCAPVVVFGTEDSNGRLHGETLWASSGKSMTRLWFEHGKAVGAWECIDLDGTVTFGTTRRGHLRRVSTFCHDGTVELCTDDGATQIDISNDGTKTTTRNNIRIKRVHTSGVVEQGDTVGGQGIITYPDPQEKKGDEPWVIREEGEFKDGKLVEGIRTKKDHRGVIYRYTAKGTLLKDPEDAALGQKLQALTEMIDRQANEIETLREQLKHK